DAIVSKFTTKVTPEEDASTMKICLVGKPNAGKSSLVNRLLGEDRVMVSDVAGTTRDAIDSPFRYNNRDYTLIDTAGIRRKRSIEDDSVELYSILRAFEAIRRSDVVILVIDASVGITEQDIRLAGFIHEEGKPSIIVMNKWDLIEKDSYSMNKFNDQLKEELKFMDYFVPLYISALTGQRLHKIMETVDMVYNNAHTRISTSTLNEVLQNAVLTNEPPMVRAKRCKIYYITQGSVAPPTFILFVNDKELMHFSYVRYLENCIRNAMDFTGTPIKLIIKSKMEKD
ncbi:MAG: ribosome biogenesis GTPase Der, partial [Clostridia bacterium]|nr:ribosome biogenesis GTPase Der [Clostridia bacterium]